MKKVTLERFTQELERSLDAAQSERILITRDGLPLALVVGVADKDEEDIALENDPEFWRMIEERRRGPSVPLEEVKRRLFGDSGQGAE